MFVLLCIASDMASLMQVEVPASCDDFQVAELIVCQEDIGFEEGCCEQACTEMLTKVSCFGLLHCATHSNIIFSNS